MCSCSLSIICIRPFRSTYITRGWLEIEVMFEWMGKLTTYALMNGIESVTIPLYGLASMTLRNCLYCCSVHSPFNVTMKEFSCSFSITISFFSPKTTKKRTINNQIPQTYIGGSNCCYPLPHQNHRLSNWPVKFPAGSCGLPRHKATAILVVLPPSLPPTLFALTSSAV